MKNEILNMFQTSGQLTLQEVTVNIVMSAVLGFFIFLSYAISHRGTIYSKKFNASLVVLTVLTGTVMTVIGNNIALSLGMVGALSIVRFRTAIKEPTDTAFMFWAIATGIICGAGYVTLAVLMTLLLGLLFVAIHVLRKHEKKNSYMVVLRYTAECPIEEILAAFPRYQLKSKNITAESIEWVAEMELNEKKITAMDALREKPGVREITVMQSVSGSVL